MWLLWSVGILAALGGCGSSYQQANIPTSAAVREEFDPLSLNDDDFLLIPEARAKPERPSEPAPSILSPAPEKANGYRVQIAAVLDRTRAENLRSDAERQLQTQAYIHYDEDTYLYKIRIGNCRSPGQAESLQLEAKTQGFREAYVIRAQIEVAPSTSQQRPRPTTVTGFRIQIFSASTRQAADQAQAQAREAFETDAVFVAFEPPFFKVRIGNYRTRKDAEQFLKIVKEAGFTSSFLVQAEIKVSPSP